MGSGLILVGSLALMNEGACKMMHRCMPGLQVGLVKSWSGYAAYLQQHPDGPDILKQLREELTATGTGCSDQPILTIANQICLVLATVA